MPEDRPAPAPLPRSVSGDQSAARASVPLPTPTASRVPLEPMPRRVIATVTALIATITIGLVVVLWWAGTAGLSGAALVTARFDALRTGLSIGIGGGGVFALYLAWRRQHSTEIGLVQKERDQADVARAYELQRETAEHTRLHAERVAATTERDAEARRITDLYAKSVEQLGSDKAPVRHGGLYALERLAQDHPDNPALRQTVVNVLCAYLRAPFDLPGDPLDADADRAARDEYRERVQEREVRLTAQRILAAHLNREDDADHPATSFWGDTTLDLTAAVLIDWNISGCTLRDATFSRTTFVGQTSFTRVTFAGNARFIGATFAEITSFGEATFTGDASFGNSKFSQLALFIEANFTAGATFSGALFSDDAYFTKATFAAPVFFQEAKFLRSALFDEAQFTSILSFDEAVFGGDVRFDEVTFGGNVQFNATFGNDVWFRKAIFSGDVWSHKAMFTGKTWFHEATLRASQLERFFEVSLWPPLGGNSHPIT